MATNWTTSTDEQAQSWSSSSDEVAQAYEFSATPVATAWVEISGEISRGYVFDGTQVENQQFLTDFGWNPIWEQNIDTWDLNREWGSN